MYATTKSLGTSDEMQKSDQSLSEPPHNLSSLNGPAAGVCTRCQATRHELMLLAKHWYRELTRIDLSWFQHQATSSSEWRTAQDAKRRLKQIRSSIGDDLFEQAVSDIDAEFREQLGEDEWRRFGAQR